MGKDFAECVRAYREREVELNFDPPVLYLETVKGCPHSCAMCSLGGSKPERMREGLLRRLEPSLNALEVMTIHGDGEPLLGDIDYFAGRSAENDSVLHMNTSGFLLTRKISDRLLKSRLSIRFSIHAGSKRTYFKMMGRDLDKVEENIGYLIRTAEEKAADADFWFSFIVVKENLGEVEDFLRLAHRCGAKSVRFMRLRPNWRSMRGVRFPDRNFRFSYFEQFNSRVRNEFLNRLPDYRKLSEELGIRIEFGTFLSDREGDRRLRGAINAATSKWLGGNFFPVREVQGACVAPWFGQLRVAQSGDVKLCCATDYSVGDLNRSTLREIWNSDRMKRIRESFRKGRIPRICGYCRGFQLDNYPRNAFARIRGDMASRRTGSPVCPQASNDGP